jgi:hypothetical protein
VAPQIADIVKSLRADRAPNDRRRSPRVGLRARVSVSALDKPHESHPGWIRDLSSGGAGLLLDSDLAIDQKIILHLPASDDQKTSMPCRVVHSTRVGSFYRIGVEFLQQPLCQDSRSGQRDDQFAALEAHLRRLRSAVLD